MEYRRTAPNPTDWAPVAGNSITGLTGGTYEVRVAAVPGASFAGLISEPVIIETRSHPVPNAGVNFAAETLTGLVPGAAYTIRGAAVTVPANGAVPIQTAWFGQTVAIIRTGSGGFNNSAAQNLSIPARPGAPTTPRGSNNGTITGVTTAMQYKLTSASTWINVPGTTISGLSGTYHVRLRATGTAFASNAGGNLVVNPRRTVTFNVNRGRPLTAAQQRRTVDHGARVGSAGALPVPTRSGHVFRGWWTAPTGGQQINANTIVNTNVIYHARWQTTAGRITGPSSVRITRTITLRARVRDNRGRIQSVNWSVNNRGRNARIVRTRSNHRVVIRGVSAGTARVTARITFREGGRRTVRMTVSVRAR